MGEKLLCRTHLTQRPRELRLRLLVVLVQRVRAQDDVVRPERRERGVVAPRARHHAELRPGIRLMIPVRPRFFAAVVDPRCARVRVRVRGDVASKERELRGEVRQRDALRAQSRRDDAWRTDDG
eukprot:31508-Pelagococcus_subviridis.AAC.14